MARKQKISTVLIKSNAKQTTGKLKDGDSYCALGVLACNKKMDIGMTPYNDILEAYCINGQLELTKADYPKELIELGYHSNALLYEIIYRLNDKLHWSFKKIGKWLKDLEDRGIIEYECS